jgi:UDP-N-acetylglucosamine acyltransferase
VDYWVIFSAQSMAHIHPTAIIDPKARFAGDVTIGPYVVIEGPVQIGAGTAVLAHSILQGNTVIGSKCRIGPAAFVGLPPQHLKADPEIGALIVGNDVTIREGATIHRSTHAGLAHATRVGDNCFLMGGVHVAHDVVMEPDVIAANDALIAGHCAIGSQAFLGGGCTIHQFARVGRLAIVGGNEAVGHDVPPFGAMRYGGLKGYNAIGVKRSGMPIAKIYAIRAAYRCFLSARTIPLAIAAIKATPGGDSPEVKELLDFIATSKRGLVPSIARHRRTTALDAVEDEA